MATNTTSQKARCRYVRQNAGALKPGWRRNEYTRSGITRSAPHQMTPVGGRSRRCPRIQRTAAASTSAPPRTCTESMTSVGPVEANLAGRPRAHRKSRRRLRRLERGNESLQDSPDRFPIGEAGGLAKVLESIEQFGRRRRALHGKDLVPNDRAPLFFLQD